jgi:hypothetical protein
MFFLDSKSRHALSPIQDLDSKNQEPGTGDQESGIRIHFQVVFAGYGHSQVARRMSANLKHGVEELGPVVNKAYEDCSPSNIAE